MTSILPSARPLFCGCCHARPVSPVGLAARRSGVNREQIETMGREVPGALLMG